MAIFDSAVLVLLMGRWTGVGVRRVLCGLLAFDGHHGRSHRSYHGCGHGRENMSGSLRPLLRGSTLAIMFSCEGIELEIDFVEFKTFTYQHSPCF
jgi:hypothetical protein